MHDQSNPFSTRCIRPGAVPFIFTDGESLPSLVARLEKQSWWGQITGPHGSGKSTLLASLIKTLDAAGRRAILVSLLAGQRRLPHFEFSSLSPQTQMILDGYEQLSWWSRRRIKSLCRRAGAGLLVTTHSDAGLPTLFETKPTEEIAQIVVERLIASADKRVTASDVASAFEATGGNIREALFRLYDVHQAREK